MKLSALLRLQHLTVTDADKYDN